MSDDPAAPPSQTYIYRIGGMTGAGNARHLETALAALEGVASARASFMTGQLVLTGDPDHISDETVASAVSRLGLVAHPALEFDREAVLEQLADDARDALRRLRRAAAIALPILLLVASRETGLLPRLPVLWLEAALALAILLGPGRRAVSTGWRMLRDHAAGRESLVAVGALVCWVAGLPDLARIGNTGFAGLSGLLMALHLAGAFAQLRARARAATAMMPGGDRDAAVWAGQCAQPPIHALAGQILAAFMLLVPGAAALSAFIWLTIPDMMDALGGWARPWIPWRVPADAGGVAAAIGSAVAVLMASAPCALALAAPAPVLAAGGEALRRGMALPTGAAVEKLRNLSILCFEKTGVLTRGEPRVLEVVAAPGCVAGGALAWAAALESGVDHPLARAIVARAAEEEDAPAAPGPESVELVPGKGVQGLVDGASVLVGRPDWLAGQGVNLRALEHAIYRIEHEGRSPVAMARAGKAVAVLAIADRLRPESVRAIKVLARTGVQPVLVTGDTPGTARVIADQCGIARTLAGVSGEVRARELERLRKETIGVVGRVRGDDPLPEGAEAGLEITLGASGPAAIADAAIESHDLGALVELALLGRSAYVQIVQNLFWAIGSSALLLAFAMLGLLPPALACLLGAAAPLFPQYRAARLYRFNPERLTAELMRR